MLFPSLVRDIWRTGHSLLKHDGIKCERGAHPEGTTCGGRDSASVRQPGGRGVRATGIGAGNHGNQTMPVRFEAQLLLCKR